MGELNRGAGGVEEKGGLGGGEAFGRQRLLYIAVSVGRCCIDRKDTHFLSIAKQEGRRGIMS